MTQRKNKRISFHQRTTIGDVLDALWKRDLEGGRTEDEQLGTSSTAGEQFGVNLRLVGQCKSQRKVR